MSAQWMKDFCWWDSSLCRMSAFLSTWGQCVPSFWGPVVIGSDMRWMGPRREYSSYSTAWQLDVRFTGTKSSAYRHDLNVYWRWFFKSVFAGCTHCDTQPFEVVNLGPSFSHFKLEFCYVPLHRDISHTLSAVYVFLCTWQGERLIYLLFLIGGSRRVIQSEWRELNLSKRNRRCLATVSQYSSGWWEHSKLFCLQDYGMRPRGCLLHIIV